MDLLNGMRAFVRVVESGSFSAVARERNVAQPTISKLVAALEAHLGAQVLRRNSRQLSLTEAGAEFYGAARRILEEIEAAQAQIAGREAAPGGLLRLAAPLAFGRIHLLPLIQEFAALYPDMRFEVRVSSRFADLIEEGLDLAIRIGSLPDSSLMARRIGWSRRRTVAAKAYVAHTGEPQHPDELAQRNCIVFVAQGAPAAWRFAKGEAQVILQPAGWLRTDDAEHVRAAVKAGIGVAHAPAWLLQDLIDSGEAVGLLADWRPPAEPIHAVYPAGRQPPMKLRVFVDFLAKRMSEIHSVSE